MKEVRQKKQLQTQLNNISADANALKFEIANKQREYTHKLESIKRLKEEIEKLKGGSPKVSEHAILRFFDRVLGYDLKAIEALILSEDVLALIDKLGGSGTYPGNGFSVVMKDYTVTTIIKN
jgi:hypothetical protein